VEAYPNSVQAAGTAGTAGGIGPRIGPLAWLAVWLIRLYQKHLSPRKGFSCPHRLVHGGPSCSEYARQMILSYGFWRAYSLTRQRLQECRAAAGELAHRVEAEDGAGFPSTPGDAETQRARRSLLPRRSENGSGSDSGWCDVADLSCDAAWCGMESCHLPHCDMPDCGNGCDCGSNALLLIVFGLGARGGGIL
jgi:putative component of membrane protein insertase Oxa1/YidC/SpoIIIJ protein YidD